MLTLAYLHQSHTYEQLAPGFGISRATAARRVNEVIDLLAAHAPGERVFADLKKWRLLRKIRCDPHRTTQIARAIATLNHQERQSG